MWLLMLIAAVELLMLFDIVGYWSYRRWLPDGWCDVVASCKQTVAVSYWQPWTSACYNWLVHHSSVFFQHYISLLSFFFYGEIYEIFVFVTINWLQSHRLVSLSFELRNIWTVMLKFIKFSCTRLGLQKLTTFIE